MKSNQVTVNSVHSNLVKMHSKSPSVMAFCPVCLGILPVNSYWTATLVTPSLGAFGVGLQAEGFPCKDRNTREACVARCRLVSAIKPSV